VEGLGVELPFIGQPIKIRKVNTGKEQTPKLVNVGDYWDAATIEKSQSYCMNIRTCSQPSSLI
jgi:hypothetical protein